MPQIFSQPPRRLSPEDPRCVAFGVHVEGNFAIEPLNQSCGALALVEGILRFANRLEPRTRVAKIVGPLVFANLPDVGLQSEIVEAQRLADIQIAAAALHEQCLYGENPLAATKRHRGVGDDLLLRGLRGQTGVHQHDGRHRETDGAKSRHRSCLLKPRRPRKLSLGSFVPSPPSCLDMFSTTRPTGRAYRP